MAMLGAKCSGCCACSSGEQCASGCCLNKQCRACPELILPCGTCEQLGLPSQPLPESVTVSFSDLPGCFAALNGITASLRKGDSCNFNILSCGFFIEVYYGPLPENATVLVFASDASSLLLSTSGNPEDFYFLCDDPTVDFTAKVGETDATASVSAGGSYDDGCTTLPSWFPQQVQYTLSSEDFDVEDACGIETTGDADVIVNCNCVNPQLEPEAYIQINPGNCDAAAFLNVPMFGCGGDYAAPQWDSGFWVFFDPTGGDPGGPGPSEFFIRCVITK